MLRPPSLPEVLRHRDFRLVVTGFGISLVGSWAYNVALLSWIFERTGSAGWAGIATVVRFVPALLLGAYGGVLAERFEQVRLMRLLDAIAGVVMAMMAVGVGANVPVVWPVIGSAITSAIATTYEPATAALTPRLVPERELGAANAMRNTVDNLVVIAGPGVGALMLLLGSPAAALGINAASYLISSLILGRVRTHSEPVDVTEGGEVGAFAQMLVGARTILGNPTAAVLVAYSAIATVVFGADTVQFLVISRRVLHSGEGFGYLLAGLGVGGVVAARLVTRLEKRSTLAPVILLGMAVYCLPTLAFLGVHAPAAGFAIQVVRGAGTLVVDVLAVTALQRALPGDVLARVFGVFGSLLNACVLVGALLMPVLIDAAGLDASLWAAGAGVPVLCLLGWPALRAMDRRAAARRVQLQPLIAALRGCDLFAASSEGAVDQLAGAASEIDAASGAVVVRQGEDADAFYVVLAGSLLVTSRGESEGADSAIRDLGPGDYFGEIGLLEHIPRTATVTTAEPTRLLRVDGAAFVEALTESAPSAALLDGASVRLARTHPSLRLTAAALQ